MVAWTNVKTGNRTVSESCSVKGHVYVDITLIIGQYYELEGDGRGAKLPFRFQRPWGWESKLFRQG